MTANVPKAVTVDCWEALLSCEPRLSEKWGPEGANVVLIVNAINQIERVCSECEHRLRSCGRPIRSLFAPIQEAYRAPLGPQPRYRRIVEKAILMNRFNGRGLRSTLACRMAPCRDE